MSKRLPIWLLLLPSLAGAEPPVAAPRVAFGEQLVQVLGGLALVLALVAALAWAARRLGRNRLVGPHNLRLVGGIALGARERILVVEVGESLQVVGVAPGRIQTLHVLDQPLQPEPEAASATFANRLGEILNGRRDK